MHAHRHHIVWCLLLAGDIAPNPGPQPTTCACCTKRVRDNQAALCCDTCEGWFHRGCVHMSLGQYRRLGSCSDPWVCTVCSLPHFSDDYFDVPSKAPCPLLPSPTPGIADGRRVDAENQTHPSGVNKGLTLWYTNCRSVKNKIFDLQATVASLARPAVILLTETWLDPGVHDSELFDPSYTVFRKDRHGRGGSVLIATPSSLCVNRREDLESSDLEAVFVEVFLPRGTVLLACVYCPPNRRKESYSLLDASLSRVRFECYKDVVLLGDFNSHIDWWSRQEPYPSDHTDDILLDITSAMGLQQVCHSATYQAQLAQGCASSFIDLVFTTDITWMLSCDVYPGLSGSDHQAIEVEYATCLPRKGRFARTLWSFHQIDHAHMAKLAHLAPWCLTTGDDCADNYELWCDFVGAIQKECVPCSHSSTRRKRSPWITPEIRKMAGRKRALFRRAARTQCQILLQRAKDLQRSIKSAISRAHSAYAHTISMKAKKDPKLFWQYFNGLQSSRQHPCFSRDHHPITSPRDIAQLFVSQFSSAFSHNSSSPDPDLLVQTIEASTSQPVTCLPNLCLSLDDLHEAARLIRPSNCAGPDLIAPTFIKSLFPYLSFSLLSL
uniref:Putative crack-11 bf n=1 Tax=Ixodes ricinus TaxID=34613 RepID=A0A147BB38_IXORI